MAQIYTIQIHNPLSELGWKTPTRAPLRSSFYLLCTCAQNTSCRENALYSEMQAEVTHICIVSECLGWLHGFNTNACARDTWNNALNYRYCKLLHDLLSSHISHHCVWSGITGHNLTPEKCGNNYTTHPLSPHFVPVPKVQLISGICPCSGSL